MPTNAVAYSSSLSRRVYLFLEGANFLKDDSGGLEVGVFCWGCVFCSASGCAGKKRRVRMGRRRGRENPPDHRRLSALKSPQPSHTLDPESPQTFHSLQMLSTLSDHALTLHNQAHSSILSSRILSTPHKFPTTSLLPMPRALLEKSILSL